MRDLGILINLSTAVMLVSSSTNAQEIMPPQKRIVLKDLNPKVKFCSNSCTYVVGVGVVVVVVVVLLVVSNGGGNTRLLVVELRLLEVVVLR